MAARSLRRLKNDLLQERRARRSEIPPSTVVASERMSPSGRERVHRMVHDEHLVADADHRASQLAVPSRTLANGSEDERLPLPVDEVQACLEAADIRPLLFRRLLHWIISPDLDHIQYYVILDLLK